MRVGSGPSAGYRAGAAALRSPLRSVLGVKDLRPTAVSGGAALLTRAFARWAALAVSPARTSRCATAATAVAVSRVALRRARNRSKIWSSRTVH